MADTKELKVQRDYIKEIADGLKSEKDLRDEITSSILAEQRALEKINELQTDAASSLRDELGLYEERRIKQESHNAALKTDLDSLRDQIKGRQALFDLADKGSKQDKDRAIKLIAERKFSKEELERLEKRFKQKQKEYINDTQRLVASQNSEKSIKSIGNWLGIADEINDTWLGKLENTFRSTKSIAGALEGVTKGMTETFTPTKIFESSVSKVLESTIAVGFEMDSALASFNKASGAGGKFNQTIDQVRFGSMAAGVGLKESTEAVQSLFEGFSSFTQLNHDAQVEVARTTAELDRMGISSKTTAQALDIGTKSLGMNVHEAIDAQKQIAATATELGVSPGKLADEFVGSLPKLAQYGKQSVQIFKSLATQSKATGISIDGLINIAQQFDTFEGAAQAAGKLNAILGGNLLNSSELLAANESERIDMLRQSISLSGRNFNELSKFEKMSIASAAGIKDMNEATRLFGASSEEFDKVKKAQDAEALSTAKITEYAQSATSAQEKFKLIVEGLSGAVLPLLNVLGNFMNTLLAINDIFGGGLFAVVIGFTGALYLLTKAFKIVTAVQEALSWAASLFTTKTAAQTAAEEANGAAKLENVAATEAQAAATGAKTALVDANTAALGGEEAAELANAEAKGLNNAVTEAGVVAVEEATVAENTSILSKLKNIAVTTLQAIKEGIKSAALWVSETALLAYAAAEEAVVTAKEKGILTSIKDNAITAASIVWTGIKAAASWAASVAILAWSAAEELFITIKEQGVLATIASAAATVWDTVVKGAAAIATGALAAVTWLATSAATAFGIAVAIATSPVGLIVLGILALVAAFVALIVYFDDISNWVVGLTGGFFDLWDVILMGIPFIGWGIELWRNWDNIVELFSITLSAVGSVFSDLWDMLVSGFKSIDSGVKDLTGGFFDLYDVVLILSGPFGWFIEIGKKVYENWETIITGIKGLFTSLFDTVSSVFDGIWDVIKSPINIGIRTINSVISKANVIPGLDIPAIPELADGTNNFGGGLAVVGEEGPELVNIPQGSNVINNETVSNFSKSVNNDSQNNALSAAGSALTKTKAEQSARQTNAMERTASSKEKEQTNEPQQAKDDGNRTIVIEMDSRELGRAVINIFDKKMKLNMTGV